MCVWRLLAIWERCLSEYDLDLRLIEALAIRLVYLAKAAPKRRPQAALKCALGLFAYLQRMSDLAIGSGISRQTCFKEKAPSSIKMCTWVVCKLAADSGSSDRIRYIFPKQRPRESINKLVLEIMLHCLPSECALGKFGGIEFPKAQ